MQRPETILVIPFADGIGDFVNMQPVLHAIRQRYPQAAVSVIASAYAHALVNDPAIAVLSPQLFAIEPGPVAQRLRHLVPQSVQAFFAGPVLRNQVGGEYDVMYNFFYLWERSMNFKKFWTPHIPPRTGAIHSIDCIAAVMEEELDIPFPPAERFPHLAPRPAAVQWAMNWLAAQGLQPTETADAALLSRLYASGAADSGESAAVARPLVALIPSSNMWIKQWPAEAWAQVNDALHVAGYSTILFGEDKSPLGARIGALAQHKPMLVSTSLDRVAALLRHCQLAIGVDTGLLHMAAAVGTRWLGLYGPTNPDVTGPYDRSLGQAIVAPYIRPDSCRSCWKNFKYEDDECRTLETRTCTDFIETAAVIEAALAALSAVPV